MNEVSRDDQLASAVCAALLVALVTSCGGPSGPVGGVTLELRASSAVTIDSVAYDVSGNGFHKTGSIDVAHSTVIRASIGGIPSGTGYTITLTAVDSSSAGLTCTGSATFDIVAGMTTLANVHLTCRVPPRTGGLLVNGTLNICPTVDAVGASPAETTVGYAMSLTAEGSDLDALPSALTYAWTTDSGTLASPSATSSTLTCTSVGTPHVTLTVSDGDCTDSVTFTVTCSMGEVVVMDAGTPALDASAPPPAVIVINEVESSGGTPGDWVEIANVGGSTADLTGYVFKDNDDTHGYVIASGTTLAAGARMVIDEASFAFGLGAADSARLFDPMGALVDSYAWTTHAAVTYGRCPDGTGAMSPTASATKGTTNECGMGASLAPWPTNDATVVVDAANTFGVNLSDLAVRPASGPDPMLIWSVQNSPSRLFRLVENASLWEPSAADWAGGKLLVYPSGVGSPDAEGVTLTELASSAIYVATERDNDVSGTSRLSVLRFDTSASGSALTATHEWNLTAQFPAVAANSGFEAIAWVPDDYLVAKGFYDELAGHAYDPAAYAGHGTGVFFVALEGGGNLYAYALDHGSSAAQRVATVDSGLPAVMALTFDPDVGSLLTHCDQACNNRSSVLSVDTTLGSPTKGRFIVRGAYEAPTSLGNYAYEGMVVAPEATCALGTKAVYFADDAQTGGHAIRRTTVPCASIF